MTILLTSAIWLEVVSITTYAIKINGKYFKDYIYVTEKDQSRYLGHGVQGSLVQEGDIIDLVFTSTAERTEVRRSIGNTIATILQIEKFKNTKIIIEPIEE